ncbi:MAG: hypothetical protein IJ375_05340 [Oscillospiraceae bacterium]|nr:hypothetical protein [Oscillospiraceae bacterium]
MIDLHSHILPGLDDGSQNFETSLEMARLAVESGVIAMVATPHCVGDRTRAVRTAVLLLRDMLQEEGIPLRLYMGMEIFGTADTARLLLDKRLFTINNSQYPLIEFSFHTSGAEETRILREVLEAGYRPLVAHPERYDYIQEDPELVNQWMEMGCLFQVNRGSLIGRFGDGARQMGMELVKRGFATVVASDAHSPTKRTPWMGDVRELLTEEVSPAAAEFLLLRNPRSIIRNEELPPVEPEWF